MTGEAGKPGSVGGITKVVFQGFPQSNTAGCMDIPPFSIFSA